MELKKFGVDFNDGLCHEIRAFNKEEATILAKAKRIEEGKSYKVVNVSEIKSLFSRT